MLRKVVPVAVCAALLVTGCEKKEPREAAPVRIARPAVRAPAGMAPLAEGQALFITAKPLTVAQYVAYLEGTDQDLPPQWQELQPGSPEAERPVAGLTRADAQHCAVWHLKRLPTAEEWQKALEIVGPRPYPWQQDGSPVSAAAETFLVQDYASGSPEEAKARRAKSELAQSILKGHLTEIEALATKLRNQVAAERTRREQLWQQLKPAFFALLDSDRDLARARALRDGRAEALDVVNQLAAAKAQLAVRLKTGGLTAEEADAAAEGYSRQLSEARAEAQRARERLQKALDAAQREVVELSRAFEEAGAARVAEPMAEAEEVIAQATAPVEGISLAMALKLRLEAAAQRVREASTAFSNLPTPEGLKQEAAKVADQLARLPADDTAAQIEELRAKMARLGEAVAREFLQENELLRDLDELVDLRARKQAADARLARLKEVLGQTSAG